MPALAWVLLIFVLCCLYSGSPIKKLPRIPHFDKIVHFVFYTVLFVLLNKGLKKQDRYHHLQQNAALFSAAFCLDYGILIELLQAFVFTWRSASLGDVAANSIGCAFGWWMTTKIALLR